MEKIILTVHPSDLTGGCRMPNGTCQELDAQTETLERLGLSEDAIDRNIAQTKANCIRLGTCSLITTTYLVGGAPDAA